MADTIGRGREIDRLETELKAALYDSGYARTSRWAAQHGQALINRIRQSEAVLQQAEQAMSPFRKEGERLFREPRSTRAHGEEVLRPTITVGELRELNRCLTSIRAALSEAGAQAGDQL